MIEAVITGAGKAILIAVCAFLAFLWAINHGKSDGKTEQEAEHNEDMLQAVKDANSIRDKLKSDAGYAKRVRDKYSR
tara:strand:- start:1683 stop:1913 length:231 start_codon:yes stop_codon:yes gene_type:complete